MNQMHATRFADALRATLGWDTLTALARRTGFCQRLRDITPQPLVCALVEALGAHPVRSVADILRGFNSLSGLSTRYKPFHNRLAKRQFPVFLREVFLLVVVRLSRNVLRLSLRNKLKSFDDVLIQDGTSFAVHDALKETFGGRFTKIRPAAVELHTLMSLRHDQVCQVALAPDKQGERDFLPAPEELRGKLLLADRGYQDLHYWEQVQAAGGYFLMRAKCDLNPRIVRVCGSSRALRRRVEGRRLQDVLKQLPRRRLDLDVEWDRPRGGRLRLRMVLVWTPREEFTILVTNVPRTVLTAKEVAQLYRLRWQIELVFKEWKSHANLHEFASAKPGLVAGLIWASLCAAALKRTLAHVSQRSGAPLPISTLITASCGAHILPELMRSVLHGFKNLRPIMEKTIRYLWDNAPRAHPERDRRCGRMQCGLDYVGLGA